MRSETGGSRAHASANCGGSFWISQTVAAGHTAQYPGRDTQPRRTSARETVSRDPSSVPHTTPDGAGGEKTAVHRGQPCGVVTHGRTWQTPPHRDSWTDSSVPERSRSVHQTRGTPLTVEEREGPAARTVADGRRAENTRRSALGVSGDVVSATRP